ncbi:MAG: DUF2520 domain-containing protein [Bacteroidia bacterium]|nr:DUF2520 domain-containing protein [Bacteroidia bacterium]
MSPAIAIIGSGNVATQLGLALQNKGLNIACVYSKTHNNAIALAQLLDTKAVQFINEIPNDLDWYIIAVNDDAIAAVSAQLNVNGIVTHTSGSVSIKVLCKHERRGVFYPLQTITKNANIDFSAINILVESADENDAILIKKYAKLLSDKVLEVSSAQRQMLHVAAVFANNFTNHLMGIAKEILETNNLPTNLLDDLILQTANKATLQHPFSIQTGPKARNDINTINKHIELLQSNPDYLRLYLLLTESIGSKTNH